MNWFKDGIEYELFMDGMAFVKDIDRSLTDVKIPSKVKQHTVVGVASHACQGSKQLRRVIIPATMQEIGANAFADCDVLDEVVIKSQIIVLRYGAFIDCKRLRVVLADKILCEKAVFAGCTNLEKISAFLGGKVNQDLFADCVALKQVLFSSGVEVFGKAFTGCSNLEMLDFFGDATIHPDAITELNNATIKCYKEAPKLMELAYEGLTVIV